MKTKTKPTRVTLEITADKYTTTVFAGKKVLSKRASVMESPGSSRRTEPGDVMDDITDPDLEEFVQSVDDLSGFRPFEVASELLKLREEAQP